MYITQLTLEGKSGEKINKGLNGNKIMQPPIDSDNGNKYFFNKVNVDLTKGSAKAYIPEEEADRTLEERLLYFIAILDITERPHNGATGLESEITLEGKPDFIRDALNVIRAPKYDTPTGSLLLGITAENI